MCLQGSAGIVDDDLTLIDFLFFFTTELAQLPLLMVRATGFLQRRVGLSTTALQHWMGYCNMYVALFYKAVTGAKHEIYSNFYQTKAILSGMMIFPYVWTSQKQLNHV